VNKRNHSTFNEIEENQWFSTWFNTPFYHLLYNKRNLQEAETLISNLLAYLKPNPGNKALDLACGNGRHSKMLNKSGLNVLGIDLAENSIREAKKYENKTLHFEVHDMRELIHENYFNYIFNLFTSFGYFDNLEEDKDLLTICNKQLKPNGFLILDYFNLNKVLENLPYKGKEKHTDILFQIEKKYEDNKIIKTIDFDFKEKHYHFVEKVNAYDLNDLKSMLIECGFIIIDVFGNYALEKYTGNSDRVVIIAMKN
jgi:2-polyprenyl-3-methyl-5-hydroxy-6-metoxy-1,4-benzoquinol methylase